MKKLFKRGRKPSQVSSQGLLKFADSISFNAQNYIPKDGITFSLFRIEILAGLTVALALVPEAIAFAFVAGVTPLSGLYAAFIVGLIILSNIFFSKFLLISLEGEYAPMPPVFFPLSSSKTLL